MHPIPFYAGISAIYFEGWYDVEEPGTDGAWIGLFNRRWKGTSRNYTKIVTTEIGIDTIVKEKHYKKSGWEEFQEHIGEYHAASSKNSYKIYK